MLADSASGPAQPSNPCAPGAPYLVEDHLRSGGRVPLSRALEDYVAIEWGIGPADIAAVFQGRETADGDAAFVLPCVRIACACLLDVIQAGHLRTSARPIGGGVPELLDADLWEVDDPLPRFATSAISVAAPFDEQAARTHWIMVDAGDLAVLTSRLCAGPAERSADFAQAFGGGAARPGSMVVPEGAENGREPADAPSAPPPEAAGLLRLPEVKALTGMSRSTIYAKAARGQFPEPLRLGARFSRWRRSEVEEWLGAPR